MAFRRFIRRRSFRRASRYDLQSSTYPRVAVVISNVSTTVNPTIFATMIAGPYGLATAPGFNLASADMKGSKSWTFGGTHFQSEYSFNPSSLFPGTYNGATDIFEAYEAIVVLPLAEGSISAPAYLPRFTNVAGSFQTGDLGDRILWKRISLLPFWGVAIQPGAQLESTMRDAGHGPQIVRTKARLDERHAVFHILNFVHGIAAEGNFTIAWDAWFRTAIKANAR